ncbi:hypothetical protein GF351_04720 [Candidatus Woesearchaeota archaeon]|nr:hypothetical protein [Candidatus Woesearchaeota archaeon]
MDLDKAIRERRTVRRYLPEDIPEKELRKIIDAANHAPSACDLQAWRFIIIRDKDIMRKIMEMDAPAFIQEAPLGILVLYDNRSDNVEYNDHIQSASAAIQNMLLTAHSMDIGCCWICHLPPKRQLRKLLDIPWNYDPIAYISMGYHDKMPAARKRKKGYEELVSKERFALDEKVPGRADPVRMIKRISRWVYYRLPFRKHIRKPVNKVFEKKFEDERQR